MAARACCRRPHHFAAGGPSRVGIGLCCRSGSPGYAPADEFARLFDKVLFAMTLADREHRLSGVMTDLVANLVGKGWVALVSVLFVPFLIRLLGIEAYGLVGFFITLQTILLLLDFGFSITLNRALAACGQAKIGDEVLSLAVTLERVFAGFAILIAVMVVLAAPWLAAHWIVVDKLPLQSVEHAMRLMGVAIALQLPFMLYAGGLTGLGRQPKVNVIIATCVTVRFGGALIVLTVSPRLESFFVWQILAVAFQTLWARREFRRNLRARSVPSGKNAGVFRNYMRFAASVGMTATLGVVLTQLDKLMLSKLLPLGEYALYMIAWTLSSMLLMLAGPVVTTFFPRLAAEVARVGGDPGATYHTACQMLSVAVMPAGAVLVLLPDEVLMLWIGRSDVAQSVGSLVALLSLGTLLNTLAQLPHALQLAYGRPRLGLYANILSVAVAVPALYFGVKHAGAPGAAWVWVGLNASYVIIGVPLMHRWLLRGHLARWLGRDVLVPMAMAFFVVFLASYWLKLQLVQSAHNMALVLLCYVAAAGACVIVAPGVRHYLTVLRQSRL